MTGVDPQVADLARQFVEDTISDLNLTQALTLPEQLALVDRAGKAMQQAIEDECEAIRRELTYARASGEFDTSGDAGIHPSQTPSLEALDRLVTEKRKETS